MAWVMRALFPLMLLWSFPSLQVRAQALAQAASLTAQQHSAVLVYQQQAAAALHAQAAQQQQQVWCDLDLTQLTLSFRQCCSSNKY